ncbi:MAG TPA: class I SAM-dependent methyltransferase [Rubricoccaceae bacterium]|jgi:hypothetical protein
MIASAFLLRTMASVAPGTRVVDVACGDGAHVHALASLGFDVWASAEAPEDVDATRARLSEVIGPDEAVRRVSRARPDALGYPDAFAPWVVAAEPDGATLAETFAEARRVLAPGGWLWTDLTGAGPDADALDIEARLAADTAAVTALAAAARATGLAVASRPIPDAARGTVVAVFRRVDADTVR